MRSTASDKERWFGLHPSHRGAMRTVVFTIVALVFGVVLAMALPSQSETRGIASYLPLHTLLETIAIVIAMMVFAVGWNAYRRGLPGNILLLACAFLGVGVLDFTHMISYPGHAGFCHTEQPGKGDQFLALRAFPGRHRAAGCCCHTLAFIDLHSFTLPAVCQRTRAGWRLTLAFPVLC